MRSKTIVALALLAAVLLPAVLAACPLCKEATPVNNSGMWRGMVVMIRRARRRHTLARGAQS
jgi:hypothetical protein